MSAVNPHRDAWTIGYWGLDPRLADRAPGLVDFLDKSGSLRNMAGLYSTGRPDGSLKKMVRYNKGKEAMIKVDGVMRTWSEVQQIFESRLIDATDPNNTKTKIYCREDDRIWTYISSEKGFVPDPNESTETVPIHQLSKEEHRRLVKHAKKFYEQYPEIEAKASLGDNGEIEERTCVFQISTVVKDRDGILKNFHETAEVKHVSMALIDETGQVYSFGGAMDLSMLSKGFLRTGNARLSTPDWEVFRGHEEDKTRLVTSMAITPATAKALLEDLKEYNRTGIRYNLSKQNCTGMAVAFVEKAIGIEIDQRLTPLELVYAMLPDLEQVPVIGWLLVKISEAVSAVFAFIRSITPHSIAWLSCKVTMVIFYIPKKMLVFVGNLFIYMMGGGKSHEPMHNDLKEEPLGSDGKIHNFSALIRSPLDLFSEEPLLIHHPKPVLDWQRQQKTTVSYRSKYPQLCIVPEEDPADRSHRSRSRKVKT